MSSLKRFMVRRLTAVTIAGAALPLMGLASEIPWRTPGSAAAVVSPRDALVALAGRPDARRIVVQFNRPILPAQREALRASGLSLLAYLQQNAYFANLASDADIDSILRSAPMTGAQAIQTPWKLHRAFNTGLKPTWAVVVDGDDPIIGAYVMLHPDAGIDEDGAPIVGRYAGVMRDVLVGVNGMVVEAPVSQLIAMAAEDHVQWIEPALPRMVELNSENRAITQANVVQAAPYNLTGNGVSVLVYDGGTARSTHQDFGGRLSVGDGSGMANHATHVSGTVGGSGAAGGGTDRGMAPGVTILSYGFEYDGSGTFLYTNPGDIEADYGAAIASGADVSNNSIGTNTESNGFDCGFQGQYGLTDATIDAVVRGSVSGGVPFRVVWAAGNERQGSRCDVEGQGDYYSSAPPGGAKNHLCIGALNANDDSMTTFSSWGPTDDGRLKPDFSAPGCESGGDGGVVSTGSASDTAYSTACGTSMASPTACGLAALLLQDYRTQFGAPDPRNSTLKALFAHTAVDRGNVGPDYQFGYGSIRIQSAIDFMRTANFTENEAGQGEVVQYRVTVPPGTPTLRITIAWDDPPATPNIASALINDLDLRVFSPTAVQAFPWTLNPANPGAAAVRTQADHLNNIEQVVVDNPAAGEWIVEVAGTTVPQGPQPYSIAGSPSLVETGVRISLPSGTPSLMTPGVGVTLPVTITAATESIVPGSQLLSVRYDGGPFITIPLTPTGGNGYQAVLPPAVCGATPEFFVSCIGTVSGLVTNPSDAPTAFYSAEVAIDSQPYIDTVETDLGWVAGAAGDTATTGVWTRVNPVGSAAQPEDDHSDPGTTCWVTGQGVVGGAVGDNDVDGGRTTLTTNAIDTTVLSDPMIGYWRWYSNTAGAAPGADIFTVQISNNNGTSWTNLEVVGPTGAGTGGGWTFAEFRVADVLPPSAQVKLRFIAEDAASGSIIEAAVDDVQLRGRDCEVVLADCNDNGIVDADDIASGRSTDGNADNVPDECDPADCLGDVNDDGSRDLTDLSILLTNFGGAGGAAQGDINNDGQVNLTDLSILLSVFGAPCP